MNARVDNLKKRLRPGKCYRREDLLPFSKSLDRDLRSLVAKGELRKAGGGLYYRPQKSRFGDLPADRGQLLEAYLKGDDFLVASLNAYNALGVGTTQLYNTALVYNTKRDGKKKIDGMNYHFIKSRRFPKKPTSDFLYVDLMNNLHLLEEDHEDVKTRMAKKLTGPQLGRVLKLAKSYGTARTRKFFDGLGGMRGAIHG